MKLYVASFRSLFGRRLSQRKRTTIYRDEVYGDETDQKVDLVDDDPQSCFYHLGNLSQDNVAFLVQSSNSLQGFSQRKPLLVLKSICIYLRATKKMSTKHRLRINRILAIVIRLADHIDGNMANILMEEAINDLVKITPPSHCLSLGPPPFWEGRTDSGSGSFQDCPPRNRKRHI
ncbi:uncharacterized protein LOC143837802 isoform X2 [Paroedura picta]|uniref:uncharacterized protein LOC143837802 isoform X2 n=1 Tax=Paroedura picta TaxID=143630 RepID=UPI004056B587